MAVIGLMLVLGVILRAKIKIFQNFLIPAAIIGGLIGFILVHTGILPFESKQFINFSMHAFIISFMSLCLTNKADDAPEVSKKEYLRGGLWMSFVWAGSFGLQAIVGGLLIIAYNTITGNSLSDLFGFIATHGFTQGPGQGLSYGKIWASLGASADLPIVGLIYANIGFFFAFYLGIDKLFFHKLGRLITQRPEFYISLVAMIIGTQLFLAGFIGEIILRNNANHERYKIKERI